MFKPPVTATVVDTMSPIVTVTVPYASSGTVTSMTAFLPTLMSESETSRVALTLDTLNDVAFVTSSYFAFLTYLADTSYVPFARFLITADPIPLVRTTA